MSWPSLFALLGMPQIEKEIGRIVAEIAAVDASAAASHEVDAKLAEWEAALVALQAEHAATVKAESRFGQLLAKRLQHLAYGYGQYVARCGWVCSQPADIGL